LECSGLRRRRILGTDSFRTQAARAQSWPQHTVKLIVLLSRKHSMAPPRPAIVTGKDHSKWF
jgi:hypothetical protein